MGMVGFVNPLKLHAIYLSMLPLVTGQNFAQYIKGVQEG